MSRISIYIIIENMENIGEIVAQNLIKLRKNAKLTQIELAEKLQYSDKAVSKWETGETTPSLEVLLSLAKIYNVTLNDITNSNLDLSSNHAEVIKYRNSKFMITLLAISAVWIFATLVFVYSNIYFNISYWLVFIWAVPVSFLIALTFNSIWGKKKNNFILISFLVWTLLASLYLQFLNYNMFIIFVLGAPLQLAIILWANIKKKN